MAGDGDAERLVVLLEARVDQFEKRMKRASGTATRSYRNMRRRSHGATRQMERDMDRSTGRINRALAATSTKIGLFGKTLIGGLVAGGIAGTISQIGRIAQGIAEIGDEAKRAGLDVKAFQELKFVAEQNRIGVDSLVDGIKELNLRADEFITTGGGSGAEAFARLGFDAETLAGKLKDPSALFTEIIGKLGELDQAAQIRVADEIFGGTGGEKFVQLIAQGEQGIRDTIEAAYDLGVVMDEETIAKADELDRQFQKIVITVGNGLKQAIVDASFALIDFFNILRSVNNQSNENLEALLKSTREVRAAYGIEGSEAYLASLEQEAEIMAELEARAKQVLRTGLLALPENVPQTTPPVDTVDNGGGGSRGGRGISVDEIQRQTQAIQSLIAGLEFERELIGLSAVDQEKLTALRQAGSAATDEQKERIQTLVQTLNDEQANAQLISANTTTFDVLGKEMERLDGLLERGAISWETYGRAAASAQAMALSSTLGALSQITSMLSSAFEDNKALAVANAVVKGGESIVNSFNAGTAIGGFPVGMAFAAAAGVATAAQISAIASTTKNSKSLPGSGAGGASIPAAASSPGESRSIYITVNGSAEARQPIEDLIAELNEYTANGATLNVSAA